jgi:hypothetical protein
LVRKNPDEKLTFAEKRFKKPGFAQCEQSVKEVPAAG